MSETKEFVKSKIKPLHNLFRLFSENNDKIEELTMQNRGLVNHIYQIAESLISLHGITFADLLDIMNHKGESND